MTGTGKYRTIVADPQPGDPDAEMSRNRPSDSPSAASTLLQYAETCDLKPGQRVRSRRHPELTGRIKCLEWNAPGVLSAIPYNVSWDNPDRAYDVLGMFALYQTDGGIEAHEADE